MSTETKQPPFIIQNDRNELKLVHEGNLIPFEDESKFKVTIGWPTLQAPYHGSQFTIHPDTIIASKLPVIHITNGIASL